MTGPNVVEEHLTIIHLQTSIIPMTNMRNLVSLVIMQKT